jgi:hypothetical protein
VTSVAAQVAEFVEQQTDLKLDTWQRRVLDGLYPAPPDSTD